MNTFNNDVRQRYIDEYFALANMWKEKGIVSRKEWRTSYVFICLINAVFIIWSEWKHVELLYEQIILCVYSVVVALVTTFIMWIVVFVLMLCVSAFCRSCGVGATITGTALYDRDDTYTVEWINKHMEDLLDKEEKVTLDFAVSQLRIQRYIELINSIKEISVTIILNWTIILAGYYSKGFFMVMKLLG